MTTTPSALQETLGNPQWMQANAEKIKAMLPETWTHIENLSGGPAMKIAFQMKLLGIDWRSEQEFGQCMVYFMRAGLMQRDGLLFRRSN